MDTETQKGRMSCLESSRKSVADPSLTGGDISLSPSLRPSCPFELMNLFQAGNRVSLPIRVSFADALEREFLGFRDLEGRGRALVTMAKFHSYIGSKATPPL